MSKLPKVPRGKMLAKTEAVSSPAEKIRAIRAERKTAKAKLVHVAAPSFDGAKAEEAARTEAAPEALASAIAAQVESDPTVVSTIEAGMSVALIEQDAPQAPAAEAPAPTTTAEELPPAEVLSIPLKYLEAALAVAAKKDVRYYLNGVHLHQVNGQTRVIATDGHRLLAINVEGATKPTEWAAAGVTLPSATLARVVRYLYSGPSTELVVSYGKGHPHVILSGSALDAAEFKVTPIEAGKYPDYQRVIDDGAAVFTSERSGMDTTNLDVDYFKSAAMVAKDLGAEGIMPFVGGDAKAPVVFTFGAVPEAIYYVMPQTPPAVCLAAPAVRMFSGRAMKTTVAELRAAAKKCTDNAKKAKHEKFRALFRAKAARLTAQADAVQAATATKIEAPKGESVAA